jgi:hypothetical protein
MQCLNRLLSWEKLYILLVSFYLQSDIGCQEMSSLLPNWHIELEQQTINFIRLFYYYMVQMPCSKL